MAKLSLEEKAKAIIEMAEAKGIQTNFFFVTTFERYQMQMRILSDLAKEIEETGATVTKAYVKGRENIYTNPAITEYNRTATAANGTVTTLINIVKSMSSEDKNGADPLAALLSEVNG